MNNKNKPADAWTQQLFNSTGPKIKNAHHKTYFGHCYQSGKQGMEDALRFNDLFALAGISPAEELPIADKALDLKNSFQPARVNQRPSMLATQINNQGMGGQFLVLNCYNETPDTKTFRLAKLNGAPADYLPGQYVTLTIVINGKEYKRSYSLASTPSQQGIIEITVKRDANGGVVSNWLNDNLKIGDTLSLKGPFGKFTCAKETPRKILFLAAGSGVVPIMSMLRWLTGTETQIDIVLLLSFRTNSDIIYRKEFELIASRHRNIRLFVTLTKQAQATGQRRVLTGRMNKSWIAAAVPDLTERAVYLCGPEGFMTVCRQYLQELKHPEERLFCESFCIDNLNHSIQQLDKTLSPPACATGSYQVKFARSGLQITTDGRTNLLVLAENSGVKISHECRSGSCGECMIKSLEGKVDLAYQAEIDEIDRKKGWVYACCAYPASNVTLDI